MAALKSVWLVIDPFPTTLDESEEEQINEICFEEEIDRLPDYIRGAPDAKSWWKEHTKVYLTEAEAKKDAEARLAKAQRTKKRAAIAMFDAVLGLKR